MKKRVTKMYEKIKLSFPHFDRLWISMQLTVPRSMKRTVACFAAMWTTINSLSFLFAHFLWCIFLLLKAISLFSFTFNCFLKNIKKEENGKRTWKGIVKIERSVKKKSGIRVQRKWRAGSRRRMRRWRRKEARLDS